MEGDEPSLPNRHRQMQKQQFLILLFIVCFREARSKCDPVEATLTILEHEQSKDLSDFYFLQEYRINDVILFRESCVELIKFFEEVMKENNFKMTREVDFMSKVNDHTSVAFWTEMWTFPDGTLVETREAVTSEFNDQCQLVKVYQIYDSVKQKLIEDKIKMLHTEL